MKRLLITGGCGFIGSNFIRRFLKTHPDWILTNLDKLTYSGNLMNTRDFESNPHYRFVQGDVCDQKCVNSVMAETDAVIHFAAETHVDRSIDSAVEFLQTNVMGTQVMLEAAMRHKITRYIHISTDEVYGSILKGSFRESDPMTPNSPYSASKAAGDLLVRAYRETYHFPAMIVRSSNNFGPFQYPEKVIPLFITNLMEDKKVPLYGKGLNERDWIFVEDNCRGIEIVFDRGKDGEAYNVGGGQEMANVELTRQILKHMGKPESMIQPVQDRLGHDFRYSIDTQKLRSLGYSPEWPFEKALRYTIEWYQANAEWWRPLKQDKFTLK